MVVTLLIGFRWQSIRSLFSPEQFPEPAFKWEHHWPEAEKLAKEQGKPMLVVFSASWCPPCKMMKQDVWPNPRVGEIVSANYVPLYIDVDLDEHTSKVAQYEVTGIPLVVVLNEDGTVNRKTYSMSADETVQFLTAK